MPSPADTRQQIEKLARVLCDEADATAVEMGLMKVKDAFPYDQLPDDAKAVYQKMAKRIYPRLLYNIVGGYVVVVEKAGDRLQ